MLVHTMHPPTWGVWGGRPELVLNLFTISASDFGETAQCGKSQERRERSDFRSLVHTIRTTYMGPSAGPPRPAGPQQRHNGVIRTKHDTLLQAVSPTPTAHEPARQQCQVGVRVEVDGDARPCMNVVRQRHVRLGWLIIQSGEPFPCARHGQSQSVVYENATMIAHRW